MRTRPLPPLDELLAALDEAGVKDAPREAPDEAAHRGLLDMALFVAEHRKRVSFPAFRWDAPAFEAADAKATFRLACARVPPGGTLADVEATLRRHAPRASDGNALLALDLHGTTLREFELSHLLYGSVTLFAWPHKPSESADPRIHAARDAGWTKTLKEHNLLPGRGIVVLDEHQGLLLRDPVLEGLLGVLALYPDGQVQLAWNPLVPETRATSEIQYWLAWGEGTGSSSEWRQLLHVTDDD